MSGHLATVTSGTEAHRLRAWITYMLVAGGAVAAGAGVLAMLLGGAAGKAVWLSAAFAYALQAAAFGLLLLVRDRPELFMAGWLGGMVLRFGAVGGLALFAARLTTLPLEPLLLSLVGFVFLLLLLEPVFLRWDLRRP